MKKWNKLIVEGFQTPLAAAMKQAHSWTLTAVRCTGRVMPGYTAHMLPPGSEGLQSSRVSQLQTSRPSPICDKGSGNNGKRTGQKRLLFPSRNITFGWKHHGNWVSFLANFRWFQRFGILAACFLILCLFILILHFRISKNKFKTPLIPIRLFFYRFLRKWSCWLASLNILSSLFPPSRNFSWGVKIKVDMLDRIQKWFFPVIMALVRTNPPCCSFPYVLVMTRNQDLRCHACPKWAICVIAKQFCLVSGSDSKDRRHVGKPQDPGLKSCRWDCQKVKRKLA